MGVSLLCIFVYKQFWEAYTKYEKKEGGGVKLRLGSC